MYKGTFKNFLLAKTTHRLPKVITLGVATSLLLSMVTFDASASARVERNPIFWSHWPASSELRQFSHSVRRRPPVTTTSPTTSPTSSTSATSGSTGTGNPDGTGGVGSGGGTGSGGAPSVTTTTAPQSTSTTTLPQSSTTTPPALGVYAGVNNQAGVNNFAATTGAHVTLAETYLPWEANTGTSVGWSYLTTQSTLASWLSTWSGTSDQMVIGVPMVALNGSGSPENTLAQGAAGDENANFVAIAKNLVALGFGNAILRPGWEFDITNGYPWAITDSTDAANFVTYWQNIVTAMRSVPGADFKFVWSPAGFQSLSWNINDAYPGNAYVDYVSLDVYDWSWDGPIFPSGDPNNSATVAQSKAVFNEYLTDTEGLNWLASFAREHHKLIAIPEWAVDSRPDGHGLGDDPTFINDMYNWFTANNVAWVVYFVDDVTDNNNQGINFLLTDGNFPNSLAAFEADFG